jgi:hypothetical protein
MLGEEQDLPPLGGSRAERVEQAVDDLGLFRGEAVVRPGDADQPLEDR